MQMPEELEAFRDNHDHYDAVKVWEKLSEEDRNRCIKMLAVCAVNWTRNGGDYRVMIQIENVGRLYNCGDIWVDREKPYENDEDSYA